LHMGVQAFQSVSSRVTVSVKMTVCLFLGFIAARGWNKVERLPGDFVEDGHGPARLLIENHARHYSDGKLRRGRA